MGRRSGFRRRTCRGCNRMRRRRGGGMWRRIRSSGLLRRHGRDRLSRGRRRGIQRLGWGSAIYCGVFLAGVGCLAVRPRRGGGGLAGRSLFLERTPGTPAGAVVPGSVVPGPAIPSRSAPAGAVESLPAGPCFSSARSTYVRRPAQSCPAAWCSAPRYPCGPPPPGRRACRPVPVSRAHLRRPAQPCPAAWDPAPRHPCGPPPPGRWRACRPIPVSRAHLGQPAPRQRGTRLRDTLAVRPRRGGGSLPAGSCFSSAPMPAGAVVPGSVVPGSLAATTPLPVNSPGLESRQSLKGRDSRTRAEPCW